jgi:hypothetical protein
MICSVTSPRTLKPRGSVALSQSQALLRNTQYRGLATYESRLSVSRRNCHIAPPLIGNAKQCGLCPRSCLRNFERSRRHFQMRLKWKKVKIIVDSGDKV